MRAAKDGHCELCDKPIEEGDEITRGNKSGSYGNGWVHVACKSATGSFRKARYMVKLYYPQGVEVRRFVNKKIAEARAADWRWMLNIKVEVEPIQETKQ